MFFLYTTLKRIFGEAVRLSIQVISPNVWGFALTVGIFAHAPINLFEFIFDKSTLSSHFFIINRLPFISDNHYGFFSREILLEQEKIKELFGTGPEHFTPQQQRDYRIILGFNLITCLVNWDFLEKIATYEGNFPTSLVTLINQNEVADKALACARASLLLKIDGWLNNRTEYFMDVVRDVPQCQLKVLNWYPFDRLLELKAQIVQQSENRESFHKLFCLCYDYNKNMLNWFQIQKLLYNMSGFWKVNHLLLQPFFNENIDVLFAEFEDTENNYWHTSPELTKNEIFKHCFNYSNKLVEPGKEEIEFLKQNTAENDWFDLVNNVRIERHRIIALSISFGVIFLACNACFNSLGF